MPGGRKRHCPSDLPLRSIPPTPYGVGPARLRPRVARVRRTIPLTTKAHPIHPSHALRRRPRPLTVAGGQGPPDDTAYDQAHIRSCRLKPGGPEHPHSVPYHPHTALAIQIQSGPSTDISYLPSPCTALVCPIHLSSGMGLSTIIRFRTISYRRDALFQIANTL